MNDLRELYQEIILDHNRQPRNFHSMEAATGKSDGFNPLCGDKITLYIQVEEGVVKDASFQGSGCAISTASASLMTDSIKGKTVEEVESLFRRMHDLLAGDEAALAALTGDGSADLGKLVVFSGVREFPMRVKCATLAWHTLHAAVSGSQEEITTE